MWKEVKKNLERSILPSDYMRILNVFPPLVAVAAGGRNEEHTVFRRCAAPEKIRIDRTEGSNSGGLKMGVGVLKKTKNDKKTHKMTKKRRKNEQKAEKLKKKSQNDSFYCVFL